MCCLADCMLPVSLLAAVATMYMPQRWVVLWRLRLHRKLHCMETLTKILVEQVGWAAPAHRHLLPCLLSMLPSCLSGCSSHHHHHQGSSIPRPDWEPQKIRIPCQLKYRGCHLIGRGMHHAGVKRAAAAEALITEAGLEAPWHLPLLHLPLCLESCPKRTVSCLMLTV